MELDKFIDISLLVILLLPIWAVLIWRLFVMIQAVRYDRKAFIIQALLFLVYMVIAGYGLKYFGSNLGLSPRAIVSVFCYTGGFEIILFGVVQLLTETSDRGSSPKIEKMLWTAAGVIVALIPIIM